MKKTCGTIMFMPVWNLYYIFAGKNTEVKSVKKTGPGKRVKSKRKNT